ncbi:metallophosphoesterase [Neobacillus niacini]|uniref:metallophosphoesterase family protein n=1 Tax=Neobacillus niacini TaxID=86668 RepID=UPI002FFE5E84
MITDKPLFSFFVISDIQLTCRNEISHQKLAHALQDLHEIDPDASALIINGDLIDDGKAESYNKFRGILDNQPHPKEVFFTIGNHEFFQNDGNEPSISRFLEFSNLEKVYYSKDISKHSFLFLGTESWGPVGSQTKDSAVLTKEQLDWLKDKTSHLKQDTKPVFVFLHQPIPYTLFGTDIEYYQNSIIQDQELLDILSSLKNVFYFSGHSHFDLRFSKMFVDNPFNMVSTGAVYNTWGPDGEGGETVIDSFGSQGLYIQVFTDHVLTMGRDFTNKRWIQEYQLDIAY